MSRWGARYVLFLLTLVYAVNIADRFVLSTLIEPIKAEFQLTDAGVGFLTGTALAIFYVTAGLPLGVLADRVNRRNMIAWAVGSWSLCTMACGLSQTYIQLLLARIGVGVGEAGGTPPSQSLLADVFNARDRGPAMSVFALGASLGAAAGAAGAGWLADLYDWRTSLIVFGAAGIPVAFLVRFTIGEPRRGAEDRHTGPAKATLGETLRYIWRRPALRHVVIGGTVLTFFGNGLLWWTPAFLARSHGLSVGEAGLLIGAMTGLVGTGVMILTAWIIFRLARKDLRWLAWFVAIATLLVTPATILAYWLTSTPIVIAMLWLFVPTTSLFIGPTLALTQSLVPASMRGQTVAVLLFTANFANLVIAPQFIGWMSDLVAAQIAQPADSLRLVLAFAACTGFWGAYHFYAAAVTLREDLERAGS